MGRRPSAVHVPGLLRRAWSRHRPERLPHPRGRPLGPAHHRRRASAPAVPARPAPPRRQAARRLPEEHNWWELGPEGPCGPDTEVFVDTTGHACELGDADCLPGTCDCGRFVEVWNNVFMIFERRGGELLPLPQANVDTGMGLERMLTVLGGVGSVYETAPLDAIHEQIAGLSPTTVDERTRSPELVRALRILTDHLRSAVFVLGDQGGVLPSNQG